jgi:hypothetical protein
MNNLLAIVSMVLVLGIVTISLLVHARRAQSGLWKSVKNLPVIARVFAALARRRQQHCHAQQKRWVEETCDALKPFSVVGKTKIRVGNQVSDGGYVIVDDHRVYDTLISYGILDDVSFELDFVNRHPGCVAHLFDHTIDGLPLEHPSLIFHKEGVGAVKSDLLDTLSSHIAQFAANSKHIFLKMDVEGAEYESLLATSDRALTNVDQIAIELHDVCYYNQSVAKLLRKFSALYRVTHVHGNNTSEPSNTDGIVIPKVLELTWLRVDHETQFEANNTRYPTDLDRPNDPAKEELIHDFIK